MKKVLAILIALLVGAAAAAGGIFYFHMKAQPKVDAKSLMERLEESSELTVEKNYYTGIVRFEEGTIRFIDKNGFNMKYEAEIDAGFELENVNIEVNDDSVVVTVPEAKILSVSIDPDSLEFYDNQVSLIKTDRKEATKQALQAAQKDAEEHATGKGILDAANKRAEVIFKGILEGGVGDREIIVNVVGADNAGSADADAAPAEGEAAADTAAQEGEEAAEAE
ncbi:MAG: DUF4230 domain-containing protein [Mogibacterium sp.]|nr:DUF4230 domain-containing protein [Mogibacterium sp.]